MRSKLLALRAGHVFDGVDVKGPGMVLVEDCVIRNVDCTAAAPPELAEVVDFGADGWLLPGLIDAHVHLCWDGSEDAVAHVSSDDRETVLKTARTSAEAVLRMGVTTVRDLGDLDYITLTLRDQVPPTERPEIVAAGPPVTSRGGHCHFLGGEAEGADSLRAAIRERAERGCDVVKVMASGGNMTPGSSPLQQQYDRPDLRMIVEEAHRLGLRTAAHAHSVQAIADAVGVGFDTIEHFSFFTPGGVELRQDLLDEVVRRGTFVSLTVGFVPSEAPHPPAVAARLAAAEGVLAEIIASGARVVPGTDAGVGPVKPHGVYPHALSQLADLGMPTRDVLRSATSEAAEAVGRAGRKGVLRAGADADLLVLGGSPIDDITAITDIHAVYRAGHRVRRPDQAGPRPLGGPAVHQDQDVPMGFVLHGAPTRTTAAPPRGTVEPSLRRPVPLE